MSNDSRDDGDAAPSPWLTKAEAAKYAKVSMRKLEYAIRDGELRAAKPNGFRLVRIKRVWVDEWICGGGGQVVLAVALLLVLVSVSLACVMDGLDHVCRLLRDLELHPHNRG